MAGGDSGGIRGMSVIRFRFLRLVLLSERALNEEKTMQDAIPPFLHHKVQAPGVSMVPSTGLESSFRDDKLSAMDTNEGRKPRRWFKPRQLLQVVQYSSFWSHRWLGWVFVYSFVLLFFFIYRCVGLVALIKMYGTEQDRTARVELGALSLGLLEDWICATYLVSVLWFIDFVLHQTLGVSSDSMTVQTFIKWKRQRILRRSVTFLSSWMLFIATTAPVVADILLVRLRSMRFTFEIVSMAIAERDMVSSVAISNADYEAAYITGTVLALAATFFASVRTWASWADLMRWNPTQPVVNLVRAIRYQWQKDDELWAPKELEHDSPSSSNDSYDDVSEMLLENRKVDPYTHTVTPKLPSYSESVQSTPQTTEAQPTVCQRVTFWFQSFDWLRLIVEIVVALVALVFLPVAILAISQASSPILANVAMDTTINELFTRALKVTNVGFVPLVADGTIENASVYIHPTENSTLTHSTTGFNGDLAFDVDVDYSNPPNVVVIAVESFRFHDSHYLVGVSDPSNLFKDWNGTVVPNFDKWAKRGVAFSNLWSSWKTSRSLASLLFGQIPYDSVQLTDTDHGRADVELAGMPQFFKKKGYETFFTTGTHTSYDDWDSFLPTHGFDTVWDEREMKEWGEKHLDISQTDWYGEAQRAFRWGVHDDVSFEVLGSLLINKTRKKQTGNRSS